MTRLLSVLLIAAVSCSEPDRGSARLFSDIDSLVDAQIKLLSGRKLKVEKKAGIGARQESVVITPDSEGWADELSVFRQLEVAERPTNRDRFSMVESEDTRSNLKVRSFVSEGTPVPYIRFFYLRDIRDIRRIEAGYYEANLLYTSQRDLTLEFEEIEGANLLHRYRVDGFQRVVATDSIHFSVEAEVVF